MIKLFRYIPFLLLISMICLFPTTSAVADEKNASDKKEVEISLSPKDTLFDVSNMKPGDWAPRTLTVKNSGIVDFDYHMQLRNNGDEMLFNELLMEIKSGDKELYSGRLSAFQGLPARFLGSGSDENLDITIRFPEHLGNDFQGKGVEFSFNFIAEAKDGTVVHVMTNGHVEGVMSPAVAGFRLSDGSTNLLFGFLAITAGVIMIIIFKFYRQLKLVDRTN
ncbi:CalY family protein [Saccharococcus sp. Marseille-Q5394]|uniref:CalY family protein n=1 Tax=Saccharococcus sp. Marseille-Q5394 TaxID=2972778 RepID=UPI0021C65C31|nr:CalY family protein [Saccharococcus sp. Marseille-Q5394]